MFLEKGFPPDWSTHKKLIWQAALSGGSLPWQTFTGNPLQFNAPKAHTLKSVKVEFSPIQSGSGDPSPDNVRPISGWTGATVWRTGENMVDQDTVYASYKQADGSFLMYGYQSVAIKKYVPAALVGKEITFSAYLKIPSGSSITRIRVAAKVNGVSKDGTYIDTADYSLSTLTFTPVSTSDYFYITYGSNGNQLLQVKDIQLNLGSTASPYSPYVGTSLPLTWSEQGTVYGGYVEAKEDGTGQGSEEWGLIDMGDMEWLVDGSRPTAFRSYTLRNLRYDNAKLLCSQYPKSSYGVDEMPDKSFSGVASYAGNNILVKDSSFSGFTGAQVREALRGVQLAYGLATHVPFSVTASSTPNAVQGINTIWSNANGDVTVEAKAEAVNNA